MTLAVSNAGDDGSFRRASRIFVRVSYLCMGPTRELGGCGEGATPSVQARDQAGRFVVNASELAIPLITCDFEFLLVLNISTWLWSSRGFTAARGDCSTRGSIGGTLSSPPESCPLAPGRRGACRREDLDCRERGRRRALHHRCASGNDGFHEHARERGRRA